ncbi:hypothetical protein EIN_292880 [Entamoeba invadens IP1]|uniref:EGF-like domain-containing protein n=1 Tax=Entamoeba invadens IP1 TaxID=370355 RepID=A0A0A1UFZ1_ENTIV|nr:hypothetical protein EIN_292880 [Entamoeba invadens IP1]ELP92059.1 hypothetical protein EIN_292880 [Entamoeba invadens IP1]|eukprot:XP_004258830.1 hypothetical protein EIN_292880 [Entamoeba invadens IP1]
MKILSIVVLYLPMLCLTNIICPPGCPSTCIANYTCRKSCSIEYDNDNSCNQCYRTDPYDNNSPVFIMDDDMVCHKFPQKVAVNAVSRWLPEDKYFTLLHLNVIANYTFDEQSIVDSSFCYHEHKYRVGKWYAFDSNEMTKDHFKITLEKTDVNDKQMELHLDGTNSPYYSYTPHCYVHFYINSTSYITSGTFPLRKNNGEDAKDKYLYYFFASIPTYTKKMSFSILIEEVNGLKLEPNFDLTQNIFDSLSKDLTKKLKFQIPFEQYGIFTNSAYMQNVFMKAILFTLQYEGDGSVFIDTRDDNRIVYMNELELEYDENGDFLKRSCVRLISGKKLDSIEQREKEGEVGQPNGIHIKVQGDGKKRYFSFLSQDYRAEITMALSIICPNDCNEESGFGRCDINEGKCVCEEGYGGDDCHLLCYYKNKWQITDNANLCYFGSRDCDQYCNCNNGKTSSNNLCVTCECAKGKLGNGDECIRNSEGCDSGGVNCNITCQCFEGYETNPDDKLSCRQKGLSVGVIVAIVITSVISFLVLCGSLSFIVTCLLKYKRIDINIYKTQQPIYHFYINGATKACGYKFSRYMIEPTRLGFGNKNKLTSIGDTRFEKIEVKNLSKNKWMMVIFHTSNSPKYTFYFEPQVLYIRPRMASTYTITCYMTIHCTTRIRDLRIPYSVWFAHSKSTLSSIADLLKNKSFDNWTEDDKKKMAILCKNVKRRHYENFVITTDAMNGE